MSAQYALVQQDEPEQLLGWALVQQRRLAVKIPLTLKRHGPGQADVQRGGRRIHVMTMQVHAGFESKRIARAQSARRDPRRSQRLPQAWGLNDGQHDFKT